MMSIISISEKKRKEYVYVSSWHYINEKDISTPNSEIARRQERNMVQHTGISNYFINGIQNT